MRKFLPRASGRYNMHLNDLKANMQLPCDKPKRSERKVNDELTFVALNFFFDPKLFLFLKITSKDNHQADLLCSGPRTELWDSIMRSKVWEIGVDRLGVTRAKSSSFSHTVMRNFIWNLHANYMQYYFI